MIWNHKISTLMLINKKYGNENIEYDTIQQN